jgi:hypothetical protein
MFFENTEESGRNCSYYCILKRYKAKGVNFDLLNKWRNEIWEH